VGIVIGALMIASIITIAFLWFLKKRNDDSRNALRNPMLQMDELSSTTAILNPGTETFHTSSHESDEEWKIQITEGRRLAEVKRLRSSTSSSTSASV
jgi:hypothetical protein